MKRTAGIGMLLAALSGCVSTDHQGPSPGPGCGCGFGASAPTVPGVQGPWGQPVAMTGPYAVNPPSQWAAENMMRESVPLSMVQMQPSTSAMSSGVMPAGGVMPSGMPSGLVQAGGQCPGGACGSNGPAPFGPTGPPGAVAAVGALPVGMPGRYPTQRTSVRFLAPVGMRVSWYVPSPESRTGYSTNQIDVPGRYNFVQAAVYRLKLSNIPNYASDLYPTLEVVPTNCKTEAFLAHSSVPVVFTEEDIEQIRSGNYLVKVIYLPDPPFQDLATTGPDEVVSTRLEPGVNPIDEAKRRGSILLVIRVGNIDLEYPNTPAMDAPNPYMHQPAAPPGYLPGAMGPHAALPPGRPGWPGPGGSVMPPTAQAAPATMPPVPNAIPPATPSSSAPVLAPGLPSASTSGPATVQPAAGQSSAETKPQTTWFFSGSNTKP